MICARTVCLATKQLLSGDIETSFLFERSQRFDKTFSRVIAADLCRVGYSKECAELIGRMLEPDPSLRPAASRVLADIVRVQPLRYAAMPKKIGADGVTSPAQAPARSPSGLNEESPSRNNADLMAMPLLEDS